MQEHNISENNFEQCLKCTICNSVCPMMAANPSYPGPKQAGPDGERYRIKDPRFFDLTLKYCLNCKRCEVACPSGVKVGDIIQIARLKYARQNHPLRDMALASTDLAGTLACKAAPGINGLVNSKPVRNILNAVGIDQRRAIPEYASETFVQWYEAHREEQAAYDRQLNYFHGCYANYNCPQLAKDLVAVMNACGYGVKLLEGERCCGVALISNGFGKQARKQARANIAAFDASEGPILTTSSTCTFTIRDEYSQVLGLDMHGNSERIEMAVKWLYSAVDQGTVKLAFKDGFKARMAYHTACHMSKLGWAVYSIGLLRMIPGLDLVVLDQECCGMAGTFGFKKENYNLSQKIGSKLFGSISTVAPDAVVTDCETCKWQIEQGTGLETLNPISVLARAIDVEKTKKLNNA
ncbi:MAG: anaerobic glycerol-3-phosphate dehydrogenase subunit C [Bacteroidales bacterium]|nr:anaerobic glycerol-3-phosphate dehydrogenase subunit C [Bacteroidales bacterium]